MEVNKKIPIMFQKVKNFDSNDTRFTKVTIWIMHLNENLNGSYFSKESVINALPSLANTPILAYLERRKEDNELDASDHREVLVRDEEGLDIKYIGQAYGCIPESCNPRFQMRVCDDGVEREYLVVDGLIWSSKFTDIDKILSDNSIKGQSMELHNDFVGHFSKEDNLYHFDEFKFYGACMLGDFVRPAMKSSTIEITNFSFDDFSKTINERMEEFKSLNFSFEDKKINSEVIEDMTKKKIEEPIVEEVFEEVKSTEETKPVVEDNQITEEFAKEEPKPSDEEKKKDDEEEKEPKEDFAKEEEKEDKVKEDKKDEDMEDKKKFEEEIPQEETTTISKTEYEELFSFKEKFNALSDEKVSLEGEISKFSEKVISLEIEVGVLKEFKAQKEKEELVANVNHTVSKFSALNELEVAEFKNSAIEGQISVDTLEEKLFALVGKKNFTVNSVITEPKATTKFSLKEPEQSEYSELSHLFVQRD